MPLPLVPIVLGGVALLALVKKAPPSSPPKSGGETPSPQPEDNANAIQTDANGTPSTAAGFLAAVGAAVSAGIGGKALDQAINPNSNTFSQTAGGIAIGVSAGVAVLAVSGALAPILLALGITAVAAGPFAAIFVAVAVAIYALIVVVQDLVRLQYGQAGAREDFAKQYGELYSQAERSLIANPDAKAKTQAERERILVPFVEGFMARLNWSAYQKHMQQKGVIVSGDSALAKNTYFIGIPKVEKGGTFPGTSTKVTDDLLWHLNWAVDRGYVVAESSGMRKLGAICQNFYAIFDRASGAPRSLTNEFVLSHCPKDELVSEEIPAVVLPAPVASLTPEQRARLAGF